MLTKLMKAYCDHRIAGLPRRAAALAAGYAEGPASSTATNLEANAKVQAYYKRKGFVPRPFNIQTPKQLAEIRLAELSAVPLADTRFTDPLVYMLAVMNDGESDPKLRLEASKALATFTVTKPGEKGIKAKRQEDAERVVGGKFAIGTAPRKKPH